MSKPKPPPQPSKPIAQPSTHKGGTTRIDVTSPPAPLMQSPFAALAASSAASPPESAPEPPQKQAATDGAKGSKPASRGRLILRRETKHRGGKTVVVISGFPSLRTQWGATLHDIEKALKSKLGCGGSSDTERGEILIQGDRPEAIADLLRGLGYEVAGVTTAPKTGR